jgi:hypothetical protein
MLAGPVKTAAEMPNPHHNSEEILIDFFNNEVYHFFEAIQIGEEIWCGKSKIKDLIPIS